MVFEAYHDDCLGVRRESYVINLNESVFYYIIAWYVSGGAHSLFPLIYTVYFTVEMQYNVLHYSSKKSPL